MKTDPAKRERPPMKGPRTVAYWTSGADDWRPEDRDRSTVWVYEGDTFFEFHLDAHVPQKECLPRAPIRYVAHYTFRVPKRKLKIA